MQKIKKYHVSFIPELARGSKLIIPISFGRYSKSKEKAEEYDQVLKALFKHTAEMLAEGYVEKVDILSSGDLQRISAEDFIVDSIESHFYETHHEYLLKQTNFFTWHEWIKSKQNAFEKAHQHVLEKSKKGTDWYNLMVKTHQEVRISEKLELSLDYQRKEYTAIMLMNEYDYIIYIGSISPAWAYMYELFLTTKLPVFSRAAIYKMNESLKPVSGDASYTTKLIVANIESVLSNHSFPRAEKERLIKICTSLFHAYGPKEIKINNDSAAEAS